MAYESAKKVQGDILSRFGDLQREIVLLQEKVRKLKTRVKLEKARLTANIVM